MQISLNIKSFDDLSPKQIDYYLTRFSETNVTVNMTKIILTGYDLPLVDIVAISKMIDWSFLKAPHYPPLIPSFKYRFRTYYFGMAKLQTASCLEFQLLERYYSDYTKTNNPYNLYKMLAAVCRTKATRSEQLKYEDIRKPLISETEIEHRAKYFAKVPIRLLTAILIYVESNLGYVLQTYGKILGSGDGKPSALGWTATFLSIAESPAFGDINEVYKTNIHTTLAYLIKKKEDNDALQASYNKQSLI